MQGYHLYEHAVIRLVPRVERGEFINIGSILYCSGEKFLSCMFHWDESRIEALFPDADLQLVKLYARSFDLICAGITEGGPIAALSMAERFRWLTASRSTILQTSPVHLGYTCQASQTLEHLHRKMIL